MSLWKRKQEIWILFSIFGPFGIFLGSRACADFELMSKEAASIISLALNLTILSITLMLGLVNTYRHQARMADIARRGG